MEAVTDLSWRIYPAWAIMVLGAGLASWGLRLEAHGLFRALRGDSAKNLTWIKGFRLSVFGLAVLGLGAAWNWSLVWLLVLSLAIGGEEILESSLVIYGLRRAKKINQQTT